MSERGATWKQALAIGGIVFLIAYGALRLWSSRGHSMPHDSWLALGVLVIMIVMVLVGGWEIRQYLKGLRESAPSPQRARRTVVLAQACALGGSAVAGWYLAHVAVAARRLDVPSGQSAFLVAVVLVAGSVGLAVAGFVSQSWCRIPHDDDDDHHGGRGGGSHGGGHGGGPLGA